MRCQLNMPIELAGGMMSAGKCTEIPKSLTAGSFVITMFTACKFNHH